MTIARALDDPETEASVLRYRHELRSGPQHARERLELAGRMLELARQVGSRALELDALNFLGRDHLELGAIPRSAEAGRAAVDLAASMLHPGARFRAGSGRVLVRLLRGELDDALRVANEGYSRDAVRNLSGRGTLRAQRIVIHTMRGDYDAVLADLAEEAREARVWPLSRYWKAHVCLALGRVELAKHELELCARDDVAGLVRDHTLLSSVALLADLCLAFEDRARAEQLYRIAAPFSGMIAAPYLATVGTCAADRGLAVLAHVLGRWSQAERHFERALELERKLASAPLVAETSARYARMLLARAHPGDEGRARKLQAESAEIAQRLGIVLWQPAKAATLERPAASAALTESGA
jgi:tetratricopeptide (TPR) repeat protein